MKDISISEMRKLSVEDIKAQMPLRITSDRTPVAYVINLEDVVVVSDLHPRVANNLKLMERRARSGMVKPEVISKEKV